MVFKILSLDGGGIRGVLSAKILEAVEAVIKEQRGQALHEYFDLISGTSTGSILAAGIACEMDAKQLIEIYKENGERIFLESKRQQRKWRFLSQFCGAKVLYPHATLSGDGLANVLKEKLGEDLKIGDIKDTQLLILAYDVLSRNTTWFANDDETEWFYETELWKICTASASAPTFFPPYKLPYKFAEKSLPHIDGGVSANNPELTAIAHALSMKLTHKPKPKINEIAVLSIGTGQTTRPYTYDEIKNWGLLKWVKNIPAIFLDPSAENTGYIAKRLFLGIAPENYLRLNFELNEWFEKDTQPGQLRKKLDKPYNEYIFRKTGERKEVSEEIDNFHNCDALIEAAECYLDFGDVSYPKSEKMGVRSAIEAFIELH